MAALTSGSTSTDEIFDKLDANHDGKLTKDEVVSRSSEIGLSPLQAAALFDELDVNKQGVLTKEQFATHQVEDGHQQVIDGIKALYKSVFRPLEILFKYDVFYSNILTDAEFDAAPMILLIGNYSVGKTSFIKYLLGRNFPGMRVGPEPTTDRFMAIMHGESDRQMPGNALTVSPSTPFAGLKFFGNQFLSRFEGSIVDASILKRLTIIDTPGVLAGAKQKQNREYKFEEIVKWFAERMDMILLLFDPFKLDISDELEDIIKILHGNEDKIRIILNKADSMHLPELLRTYGALMWALGKVIESPEVPRVYIGSFWDTPPKDPETKDLLIQEMDDLVADLCDLPRNSAVRKVNDLVKRVRLLRAHALIMLEITSQMPMMGKKKKREAIIADLPNIFRAVCSAENLPAGDFPDLEKFTKVISEIEDFSTLPSNDKKMKIKMKQMEKAINDKIPRLMTELPGMNATGTINSNSEKVGADEGDKLDGVYR